jgi:glycosyltransferase involved in cell wall biosynthesis
MTILYISQNGITTHIGRSQVAPYVLGLAGAGFSMSLLSAEPEGQDELIAQYEIQFREAGIRWTRVLYRNQPAIIGPVLTQFRLSRAAHRIVGAGGVEIVHCRSHPTAVIGYSLKKRFGLKFVFDFRDFYADWGLQYTRGLKRFLYKRIKRLEGPMLQAADRVICLTNRACDILNEAYFGAAPASLVRFQVVPCCADFAHFDLTRLSAKNIDSARAGLSLPPDGFVLLYLGSLGTDYLLREMIALFRQLLAIQPNAYFLFLSNNGEALVSQECERQSVPYDRIRVTSAPREAVPAHIALAALSVVFIRADYTKAGCSPTKLAELFACNVPVIANTGVGDLDTIIDPKRNASVLVHDFSDVTLRKALEKAMASRSAFGLSVSIRENSRVFSLEEGVNRYAKVYSDLLRSS